MPASASQGGNRLRLWAWTQSKSPPQLAGTQSLETPNHCHLQEAALATSWSEESEPDTELRHYNMERVHLHHEAKCPHPFLKGYSSLPLLDLYNWFPSSWHTLSSDLCMITSLSLRMPQLHCHFTIKIFPWLNFFAYPKSLSTIFITFSKSTYWCPELSYLFIFFPIAKV